MGIILQKQPEKKPTIQLNTQTIIYSPHKASICSIQFTADNNDIITGCFDKDVKRWSIKKQKCIQLFNSSGMFLSSMAYCIACSPDNKFIACGGKQNITLHSLKNNYLYTDFPNTHDSIICSLAFSPDSTKIASGSNDLTVRLWDIKEQKSILCCRGHRGLISSLAFSPDGKYLISASQDETLRIWNLQTQQREAVLNDHTQGVIVVAFAPNGEIFASGSDDKSIIIWDFEKRVSVFSLLGHSLGVCTLQFSSDQKKIYSCGKDTTCKIWDITTKQCIKTIYMNGFLNQSQFAISTDEKYVAYVVDCKKLAVKNIQNNDTFAFQQQAIQTTQNHSIISSPIRNTIFTLSTDQTIKEWNLKTGECLKSYVRDVQKDSKCFDISQEGRLIAYQSQGQNMLIKIINIYENKQIFEYDAWGLVSTMTISPDGSKLIVTQKDLMRMFSIKNKTVLWGMTQKGYYTKVAFFQNGKYFIVQRNETISIWSSETRVIIYTFKNKGFSQTQVHFELSQCGQNLIIIKDRIAEIWNLKRWKIMCRKNLGQKRLLIKECAQKKVFYSVNSAKELSAWKLQSPMPIHTETTYLKGKIDQIDVLKNKLILGSQDYIAIFE